MTPDDFPDITPSNRYYMPRPKEAFSPGAGEPPAKAEEPDEEEEPTMQLRCELEIVNTGIVLQP